MKSKTHQVQPILESYITSVLTRMFCVHELLQPIPHLMTSCYTTHSYFFCLFCFPLFSVVWSRKVWAHFPYNSGRSEKYFPHFLVLKTLSSAKSVLQSFFFSLLYWLLWGLIIFFAPTPTDVDGNTPTDLHGQDLIYGAFLLTTQIRNILQTATFQGCHNMLKVTCKGFFI